jgi:hypothetical protein
VRKALDVGINFLDMAGEHGSGLEFRGNYRLVFDNNSPTYSFPKNMPDEIKAFAARNEIKP